MPDKQLKRKISLSNSDKLYQVPQNMVGHNGPLFVSHRPDSSQLCQFKAYKPKRAECGPLAVFCPLLLYTVTYYTV